MVNKQKHLTDKERFVIEKMLKAGDTLTRISNVLGRGVSTISEEVARNGGRDRYNAKKAEQRAHWRQYRKKRSCNKVAMNRHTLRFVEQHLVLGWSPEAIAARLKKLPDYDYASPKSIRKYIQHRSGLERFLFWHRVHKKSGKKRTHDTYLSEQGRRSIDERGLEAEYSYGHWEGDFIVSKCGTWVLLVLVEKYTKTMRFRLLPNRKNDLVNEAVRSLLEGYMVNSLTLDNDIAFTQWRQLEILLGAPIYFCHPYHSWEKGLVENINRWIRQFIPKGANLALYTNEKIQTMEDWMNHTARVCLEGATPYEMMVEKETGAFLTSLAVNLPDFRIRG